MTPVKLPVLALRIAIAGKRKLGDDPARVAGALATIFDAVEARLLAIRDDPRTAGFYGREAPKVTLVSGLADGADQLASEVFLDRPAGGVARALGVILPFPPAHYCAASAMADQGRFDRLIDRASYVVELDAESGRDAILGESNRPRRVAGYRAQAEAMLHHADLLVAVDDEADPGREGGTRETTRRTLENGLPVIRLFTAAPSPHVLTTVDQFDFPQASPATWRAELAAVVDELVLPVRHAARAGHGHRTAAGPGLVDEFFGAADPRPRLRQRAWRWFERRFKRPDRQPEETTAAPLEAYRQRASALSRHYAGLYRGTFLLGYALAVLAVVLAGLALVVLLMNPTAHSPSYGAWWVLLGLGLTKLLTVLWIQRAARAANTKGWSERAVDYRYLAEALRTMAYLPQAASFRPPRPLSAPFATRVAMQGEVDRLFRAVIRQVDPAVVTPPATPGGPIRPNARAALTAMRDGWLAGQLRYHRRNAGAMAAMSATLERAANGLSIAVVTIVALDLVLLVAGGLHWLPRAWEDFVFASAPWLLFLAAILPAAIAALNGIRFQSECARLADRSEQMAVILEAFERRASALIARDIAAGAAVAVRLPIVEALRLSEEIARVALDEVADWSALYAKEMVEP